MPTAAAQTTGVQTRTLAIALVIAGSTLMALGARLAIPIGPVPITLQTMALPVVVLLLGTRLGTLAMFAYLAEGAAGLPVFASVPHSGLPYLIAPSSGYLWAYPIAAFVTGTLLDRGLIATFLGRVLAIAAGTVIVFVLGAAWLSHFVGGPGAAIALGVVPFLFGDALKIAIVAGLGSNIAALAAKLGTRA